VVSFFQTNWRDWVLVRVSRPRSNRQFSGLFLPQQGTVLMFVSSASHICEPKVLFNALSAAVCRTTDRAGRAPTRPFCDTRPMGGRASFSFFCSGRAGGRRLKIHAGPGGWAVDISTGRPWASPGFWPFFTEGQGCFFKAQTKGFFHIEFSEPSICLSAALSY